MKDKGNLRSSGKIYIDVKVWILFVGSWVKY